MKKIWRASGGRPDKDQQSLTIICWIMCMTELSFEGFAAFMRSAWPSAVSVVASGDLESTPSAERILRISQPCFRNDEMAEELIEF